MLRPPYARTSRLRWEAEQFLSYKPGGFRGLVQHLYPGGFAVTNLPWPVVERSLILLVRGYSTLEVSRRTGVPRTTIAGWGKRVGMEFVQGYHGGAHAVDLMDVVPESESRKYRRLTLADRAFIQAARSLAAPLSMRGIASELGVAASTVSREIAAHGVQHGRDRQYVAEVAHYRALAARPRLRPGSSPTPYYGRE